MKSTFAIYRIVGNDLPARHGTRQSLTNIRFILDNESDFDDCQKFWILNRLVDEDSRDSIANLLEGAGQDFHEIPFDQSIYREAFLDPSFMPNRLNPINPDLPGQNATMDTKSLGWIFRKKSQAVVGINNARNLALKHGHKIATWVMPLDGQCFMTSRSWRQIANAAERAKSARYIVVPMARVGDNRQALRSFFRARPREEPQIIVGSDARESFDESLFYGDKNKSELLRRLNVPGRWHDWKSWDWAPAPKPMSIDKDQFVSAGWVSRLDADAPAQTELTPGTRWSSRFEGIATFCRRLDETVLDEDRLRQSPKCYPPDLLRNQECLRRESRRQMQTELQSVTAKENLDATGDPHDYVSLAPYHHVTADGRTDHRDGVLSPDVTSAGYDLRFDRLRLQRMIEATCTLALAGDIFDDRDCCRRAAALVRTWFIDEKTRMNPHTKFAQISPGDASGLRAYGIIDFCHLWAVLDAVRILVRHRALAGPESACLVDWFSQFHRHLTESPQGRKMAGLRNNIGTYYDLTVGAIAAFLGDKASVAGILNDATLKLCFQIDGDGRLYLERKRTRPLHYQLFNVQAWIALAGLAWRCGLDLWQFRSDDEKSINAMFASVIDDYRDQSDYAGHEADFDRRISIMLSSIPEDSADFAAIADRDRQYHDPQPGDWKYGFPPCWSLYPAR